MKHQKKMIISSSIDQNLYLDDSFIELFEGVQESKLQHYLQDL